MEREIHFERVETVLGDLSYPVMRPDAAGELAEVRVVLSDREDNLGRLVSELNEDAFRSKDELHDALCDVVEAT